MGFFSTIGSFIMTPLYYAISAIMLGFHEVFSLFLDPEGGLGWALSIIGLTIVIRILLIPLFVKQIKSQRNMQLLQPKVKELQKKYGHDRQRLGEETMKLYKDAGTNPFASCLPLILQMPIFFALFRILDQAARNDEGRGLLTDARAQDFANSDIFGSIPIADSFWGALNGSADGGGLVMAVSAFLVLAMTATTFTTQKQLMSKNMPADAMTGPYAQQQKMLLYVLPVAFGLGGVAFPIGVLLYWTTSNLWTMGQQFYVIRNNPAPGTPAFEAKEERDREKRKRKGEAGPDDEEGDGRGSSLTETEDRRPTQRQQPKRQSKAERQRNAARRPTTPERKPEPAPRPEPEPEPEPTAPTLKKTNHPPTKKKKQGGRR